MLGSSRERRPEDGAIQTVFPSAAAEPAPPGTTFPSSICAGDSVEARVDPPDAHRGLRWIRTDTRRNPPSPPTRSAYPPPEGARRTLRVDGSTRETVSSSRFATQRRTQSRRRGCRGRAPTGIPAVTRFDSGSMTATAFPWTTTPPPDPPSPRANTGTPPPLRSRRSAPRPRTCAAACASALRPVSSTARTRSQPLDHELVQTLRLLDVLQPPLTDVADGYARWQILLSQPLGRPRKQYLPAVAGSADASRSVDADTDVSIFPTLGSPVCRPMRTLTCAPSGQGCAAMSLCGVHRRGDRIGGGSESDEERVALGIHDPTSVRRERCTEDLLLCRQQLVVAVLTEPVEQPRRPLDVREQEADSAGGQLRRGHSPQASRLATNPSSPAKKPETARLVQAFQYDTRLGALPNATSGSRRLARHEANRARHRRSRTWYHQSGLRPKRCGLPSNQTLRPWPSRNGRSG